MQGIKHLQDIKSHYASELEKLNIKRAEFEKYTHTLQGIKRYIEEEKPRK
jgi:hypothetical protein